MKNNFMILIMVLLLAVSSYGCSLTARTQEIDKTKTIIETTVSVHESVTNPWEEAYRVFLDEFQGDSQYNRFHYLLRDLDHNGVPELIIEQAKDDGGVLTVYSYDGYVFELGNHTNPKIGISSLHVSDNPEYSGLFMSWWGGGVDHYEYLTVKDKELIVIDLWYIDHMNETEVEVSSDKQLINESKNVEKTGNMPDMYPINTIDEEQTITNETPVGEREIYYQYIEHELIPQYGLASLNSANGIVTSTEDPAWFYPGGIVSAYIDDLNQDNNDELLVFYFQENGATFSLYAAVYELQDGVFYKMDETKVHAYNGREVSINANHWFDTNLFISSITVGSNKYIVFEFTEFAPAYAELYYRNYWGIELVDDKLQFSFSFSQSLEEVDSLMSFVEYRFRNGILDSETPVAFSHDFKESINNFFDSVGIAALYDNDNWNTRHNASILQNQMGKENILSYQINNEFVKTGDGTYGYKATLSVLDYTEITLAVGCLNNIQSMGNVSTTHTVNASNNNYVDQYKSVINAYIMLEQSGYTSYDESILGDDVCLLPNGGGSYFIGYDTMPALMYTFYDLNGNGIPELLIGANLGADEDTVIPDMFITGIYGLQDGKPVSFIQVGGGSQLNILTDNSDNCIINKTSGTNIDYVEECFYKIDQNETLITLDKLYTYGKMSDYNNNDDITFSHTKDVNGKEEIITEQEYRALMQKYGSVRYLDDAGDLMANESCINSWKPLMEYK